MKTATNIAKKSIEIDNCVKKASESHHFVACGRTLLDQVK